MSGTINSVPGRTGGPPPEGPGIGVFGDGIGIGVDGHGPVGVHGMGGGVGVLGVSSDAVGVAGVINPNESVGRPLATYESLPKEIFASKTGLLGSSSAGRGVWGRSDSFIAVAGDTTSGSGVWGATQSGTGVVGVAGGGSLDGALALATGVLGKTGSPTGRGVWGSSDKGMGTVGDSSSGTGVLGHSLTGPGVQALSDHSTGIEAHGSPAGHFVGDVNVKGTVYASDVVLNGKDCAEDFDVCDPTAAEPGTVLVIGGAGHLQPSGTPYDRRVAGVVSGAGDLAPGVVLGRTHGIPKRAAVALVGRVFCKVDATGGDIVVGDLLTTSSREGFAMKASDPARAFGAVIGKALAPLTRDQGLIPILVCLQ